MLKMDTIQGCPLCGGKLGSEALEELGLDEGVLQEVRILREQGKLTQAIFLAVKIVKTVQDNPQWMKDLLDEQTRLLSLGIKDSIHQGNSEILKALHELIGNPLRGKIQEVSIAKRLKAVTPVDSFTTENSARKGEDVECTVLEANSVVGTIIVESKRVKSWSQSYIDQVKEYMTKRGTEFAIVATTAMPSDALSDSEMIDGVLVVKVDYVEIAYLFMRRYLVTKSVLEREYQSRLSQLEVGEQVLQELRTVVNDGGLDQIISTVTEESNNIDSLANKTVDYVENIANQLKKRTGHIRTQVTKLMSDHVQVIRAKLESTTCA
jgi:hypothetical protein